MTYSYAYRPSTAEGPNGEPPEGFDVVVAFEDHEDWICWVATEEEARDRIRNLNEGDCQ